MHLATIDWIIILGYLLASLGIGFYFANKAGSSKEEFFLSGRRFPWWVVGTSMVATSFAADTPLAVTEFVRQFGIWQNWYWWSSVPASLLAVFLFSRLWRRAEVLTENELIELRYSGKPAAFLRGFKALFFATFFNLVVMGWVLNAMTAILSILLDVDKTMALWACAFIALVYAVLSGFYGVVITDLVQFVIATVGSYALAIVSVQRLGGTEALLAKLDAAQVNFLPPMQAADESFLLSPAFKILVFVCMMWWCRFDVDGGGYIVQRMSSAKSEAHSLWGTLWFYFLFYVVRAWPWIIVALASVVAFPDVSAAALGDKAAYPMMIREYLGPGFRGLLIVSFLAAFMSTIDTHLNWGASYLVHDIYARFMKPNSEAQHYVLVSKGATVVLMFLAVLVASFMGDISSAWEFLMSMGAGAGLVLLMRWFYWRINAWSELTAMASSIGIAGSLEFLAMWQHRGEGSSLFAHPPVVMGVPLEYHLKILIIFPISLLVTALVTYMTEPEPPEKLRAFYQRVGPGGWWKPEHAAGCSHPPVTRRLFPKLVTGTMFLVGGIFAVGYLFLGHFGAFALAALVTIVGLAGMLKLLAGDGLQLVKD